MKRISDIFISGTIVLFLFNTIVTGSEINKAEKQVETTHADSARSQLRINSKDEEIRTARAEYLNNERMADVTEAYNRQISRLIESQERELEDLQVQLDSIEETDRSVLPMLNRMVETLKKFVEADLPFLPEERQNRLDRLEALLLRADVSVAEKYRQILEAYMVEVQYGRTFEAYSGTLQSNGKHQVNFLRLGRTAFYYQTLNGLESGLWRPAGQQWQILSDAQNLTIRKAILIARQQKVPELINLPLPQPEPRS